MKPMKKKMKKFLTAAAALLLCLSLSSCGFVEFIRYDNSTESEDELSELRQQYMVMLNSISSADYYREEERRLYTIALLDAQNEFNECQTEEELQAAYEKHFAIISNIPIDVELALLALIAEVEQDIEEGVYREKEEEQVEELIELYRTKLQQTNDFLEIQKLLSEFKTELSQIKTDENYLYSELVTLKKELSKLGDEIDYSKYRTEQRDLIERTVKAYQRELTAAKTAKDARALFDSYTKKVTSIASASALLAEERKAWKSTWQTRLSAFTEKYSIEAENEIEALLERIAQQMSAEAATLEATEFMLSYANELSLAELKKLAEEHLSAVVVKQNYRAAEQTEISDILSDAVTRIASKKSAAEVLLVVSYARDELCELPTNDALWAQEDESFASAMQNKYGTKVLAQPESLLVAKNNKELAAIIDYYAFYQLDGKSFERETFRVRLDFAHKYADYVIKDVYWYCELIRAAVGLTGYFELDSSQLVITLVPYDLASVSNTDKPIDVNRYDSKIEYSSNSNLTARPANFDNFKYYELAAGKEITVWNSQQLWYALEHGYLPCPVEGSIAEQVLEKAKEILRVIIKEGMTTEEKVFAMHAWYADHVTYDYGYSDFLYVEDRVNFPDSMAATLRSYFAEGALLENLAVCCGYAKSFLIMLRLEGIESYRVMLHQYSDNRIDNLGRQGYGSHAIIAIKASDGKFYYCDMVESAAGSGLIYQKYHQLLVTAKEQYPYSYSIDRIWNHLDYGTSLPMTMWNNLTYAGKSVLVKNESDVRTLVETYIANATTNSQINIFYHGEGDFSVGDILGEYEEITYYSCIYGGLNEYMIHYTKK
ncbi:MAG: hypothetical protein J6Q82_03090 [Clostridia bacterium]|nr:hypothetical protein [Clostridia bacterium]